MTHDHFRLVFAYIDPGGGEFLLQILLGSIFAWIFRFRRMIFGLFRGNRNATEKPPRPVADPVK